MDMTGVLWCATIYESLFWQNEKIYISKKKTLVWILGPSFFILEPSGLAFVFAVKHNWDTMKTSVANYIGSLNWGYRVALRDKSVNYVNSYAEFVDPHKIKVARTLHIYTHSKLYIYLHK